MSGLFISIRRHRLDRKHTAVHLRRDCGELVKGSGDVAELPDEGWRVYLSPCGACWPSKVVWGVVSPAPVALFEWYGEALSGTSGEADE